MYCGHARVCVCLSVCLSAAACPHYCTDPDVTRGSGRGCPLVVHYWADLQSVHGLRCYGNITRTRNVSEYTLVLALCLVIVQQRSSVVQIDSATVESDKLMDIQLRNQPSSNSTQQYCHCQCLCDVIVFLRHGLDEAGFWLGPGRPGIFRPVPISKAVVPCQNKIILNNFRPEPPSSVDRPNCLLQAQFHHEMK